MDEEKLKDILQEFKDGTRCFMQMDTEKAIRKITELVDSEKARKSPCPIQRFVMLPDCSSCVSWVLGCLNGRKKWADKAICPNARAVGQSGREYPDDSRYPADESEYPLRYYCDAFERDSNPERQGRAVC